MADFASFDDWTPEAAKITAEAVYGAATWQTRLAEDVAALTGAPFTSGRVRQWFFEKNSRPIPHWVRERLTELFLHALARMDAARERAVDEIAQRHGWRPTYRDGEPDPAIAPKTEHMRPYPWPPLTVPMPRKATS